MNKLLILLGFFSAGNALAADEVKPFSMDGELGYIATTGNTETTSIKGKLFAHQELAQWSNDFMIEALYKKDKIDDVKQTTAQKYFLSGQGNYKLDNPDHRLFGFASYEDDKFSSFDSQATLAAGWSQKMWGDNESQFSYSMGPGYSFAETNGGENQNGLILRAALDYQWKISDTANFKQLLSSETGDENTKSKSETSVSAIISGALSLKVSLILDYNSDVADDIDNLDTQTAVTLVYNFF
jgi:putative salt-induced outer membrane protein|tara:strand:- start:749 stop:1471 length:723 start_codon:yes stop_codon:yes gene_type:complete